MKVKQVFPYPSEGHHVQVDAALICCIDPRFWNPAPGNGLAAIDAFMRDQNLTYVPLTEAGGIKPLVSGDPADTAQRESLLFRIEQELALHHPKMLAISVHRDCGGYGYFAAFGNDTRKESAKLEGDLEKAVTVLHEKFGAQVKEIRCFIFGPEGVDELEYGQNEVRSATVR